MGKRKIECNNKSCKHHVYDGKCDTCIVLDEAGKCQSFEKGFAIFWLWAHALSVSGAKHPARTALIVCAAYAASDEFHQCFSDGRGPSPVDVMIDTVGAAIALLLRAAALHIRERGEGRKP